MIDWPDELVSDIARRRSVLFLGAGVSKNAQNKHGEHPKDWREFLNAAAALIHAVTPRADIHDCLTRGDLLTACELIRKYLRADAFKSLLFEEYLNKGFEPATIHDDIVKLDSRFVLTTNFDRLYEIRANHLLRGTVLIKNYYDQDVADVLRRSQRSVVKIHGTIDLPDLTVFTRSDYARARNRHALSYRVLEALLLTHTFVFIGASMNDPDMQLILENHAYQFSGSRPHYAVMPVGSTSAGVFTVMEDSMNLRAIQYDPTANHRELAESLSELADLVLASRKTLTQTMDW